jgi:hypothetical protein
MRRNRALKAEKTQPRILQRMKDAMEKAHKFNAERAAEKERKEGVEMKDATESVPQVIPVVETGESSMETNLKTATFDVKTGIMSDGTKPSWMSDKKFKKIKPKRGKKDKFGQVTEGLGPHRKFLKAKKKNWRKK